MKKFVLLAAAAVALSASAADYYVIGAGVNGASWELAAPDAKMTMTQPGIYEWTGKSLKSSFKINDGTWTNEQANFGSNGSVAKLGEAYKYAVGYTQNIELSVDEVANPKVVLNLYDSTITVTGQEEVVSSYEVYLTGSFNEFNTADPAYKFTDKGDNVFELHLDSFDSDFKVVSNGTSFGYVAGKIESGVAYTLGDTGFDNSVLAGAATDVTFTYQAKTKTLTVKYTVGGDTPGDGGGDTPDPVSKYAGWYVNVPGGFNGWEDNGVECNAEGVATVADLDINTNEFKIKVWDGTNNKDIWYSTGGPVAVGTPIVISGNSDTNMTLANPDAKKLYSVTFNCATATMTIEATGTVSVAEIEAADEAPVYFNLQGVKVANPENGIFVKVQGGKTSKVVLK